MREKRKNWAISAGCAPIQDVRIQNWATSARCARPHIESHVSMYFFWTLLAEFEYQGGFVSAIKETYQINAKKDSVSSRLSILFIN